MWLQFNTVTVRMSTFWKFSVASRRKIVQCVFECVFSYSQRNHWNAFSIRKFNEIQLIELTGIKIGRCWKRERRIGHLTYSTWTLNIISCGTRWWRQNETDAFAKSHRRPNNFRETCAFFINSRHENTSVFRFEALPRTVTNRSHVSPYRMHNRTSATWSRFMANSRTLKKRRP